MALNIRNAECEALAALLARLTGENKTEAIIVALRERIERVQRIQASAQRAQRERIEEILRHFDSLPVLDPRSLEEILGYDENGLPT